MKTIVNKLRFALLLGFAAIGMTALAQMAPNINKMSISTQMFLDELKAKTEFKAPSPSAPTPGQSISFPKKVKRAYADPDTIDGKIYIAAFVRITEDSDISSLEDKGVIVQTKFENGLLTTLIPIDKIDEVTTLEGVKKIEVSALMHLNTNIARQTTNADDVLSHSNDAVAAGLTKGYDGSGVVLGIIDSGIDFSHIAFKDKNGNNRIKQAYVYNGNTASDWYGTGTVPSDGVTDSDHGTHTSSIAGGSSVIVSGTNVSVTDDHANATYGGMAPGADLFLCGLNSLSDTYIANAFSKMCDYADNQNKPLVVSNSYGASTLYARDGNSSQSEIIAQLFGESHPNRICLFAVGNEAEQHDSDCNGGVYLGGNATSANPISTICRSLYDIRNPGWQYYYQEILVNAVTHTMNDATDIGVNLYILNSSTGALVASGSFDGSDGSFNLNLSSYFSGYNVNTGSTSTDLGRLGFYFDQTVDDGRKQLIIYAPYGLIGTNYILAFDIYAIGGNSQRIDMWSGDYCYFTNNLTTSGHNWQAGSGDMSASNNAVLPQVISVGSYVTRNGTNSVGDISDFSSYALEGNGPLETMQPWITAPGEVITAAMNHNATSHDVYQTVVNNANNPYGTMAGTSMSSPAAAGIVALWMQAAQEVGKDLTVSDVKEVMKETAIRDSWVTSGTNASHFGNGKINALAGIEYILATDPTITVYPNLVTFVGEPGGTYTQTVTVRGLNLTDDIIAALSDVNGVFSISPTNLGDGGELVITFTPNEEGEYTATITLSSNGAEPVTITVHATATVHIGSLTANEIVVPAYHSDLRIGGSTYIFSENDVTSDIDKHLEYPDDDSDVEILVKSDEPITGYNLQHKNGEDGAWSLLGSVAHQGNSYVYGETTKTFGSGETEMWFPMDDNSASGDETFYTPVTVANGVITSGNTYGAPIMSKQNDDVSLSVVIGGSKSDKRLGGHWTHLPDSVEYCVYTTIVDIISEQLDGVKYRPYKYRAWVITTGDHPIYNFTRGENNAIIGTTPLTTPYLLGELTLGEGENGQHVSIGHEWDPDTSEVKMQNAFGAPCQNAQISVVVRAYYQPGDTQMSLRGNRDGDMYGFSEEGGENNYDLPTGVVEIIGNKTVVDVTYVNMMGMTSHTPFDGVNIVVTRFSDGTTSTVKIIK